MLSAAQLDSLLTTCQQSTQPLDVAHLTHLIREKQPGLSGTQLLAALTQLQDFLFGLGPLEELINAPGVTDVLVNSYDEVWVDDATGLHRTETKFTSATALRTLVSRLVLSSGAALDEAHPFVSFVLPNGLRVHSVISPICSADLALSIRKPAEQSLSLEQLYDLGTLSQSTLERLRQVLELRENFLICGATGSGKTTLLRAMLNEVDSTTRVLVLEDTPELKVTRSNTVSLTSRANNADGIGGINLAQLVQESLRMRPDRIVVGEVRSIEVLDLLRAMNTGHAGSAGTLHANSAHDVPIRLAALCQLGGVSLEAAHALIGAAIDVVIEIAIDAKRQRSVLNIARVGLNDQQRIVLDFAPHD